MSEKREQARRVTEARRAAENPGSAAADRVVIAALRTLGFRADETRRAAALSHTLADAPLEERVRLALSYFRPRAHSPTLVPPSLGSAP